MMFHKVLRFSIILVTVVLSIAIVICTCREITRPRPAIYVIHYLPDGSINEYYIEGSGINYYGDSYVDFTVNIPGRKIPVHINGDFEYVKNPNLAMIQQLRTGHNINFSNLPSEPSRGMIDHGG